jgi:transcriptional regulator with XRE-family HTH domain
MSLDEALAAVVRGLRKSRGLSQEDLNTVDRSYLSRIERGRNKVTVEILHRIAVLLEVDVSLLLVLMTSLLEKEPADSVIQRLGEQVSSLKKDGVFSSIDEMLATKRPVSGRDRKAKASQNMAEARRMRATGASLSEIAEKLNLSKSTVHEYLKKSE